ncbi:MAG: hypothetical protein IJZ08_05220 [Clostridia bacterium]|nr:hypothetical protein [Clostridia bacterium]
MKRFTCLLVILAMTVLLASCVSLRAYTLGEVLPAPVDEVTMLALIDSVTVSRASDGAEITLTGTDVELFMLSFDGIPCMRRKAADTPADYTVTFAMTDKTDTRPPLYIVVGTGEYAPYFLCGEYEYEPVNMRFDITYIDSLFG